MAWPERDMMDEYTIIARVALASTLMGHGLQFHLIHVRISGFHFSLTPMQGGTLNRDSLPSLTAEMRNAWP